MKLPSLWSAQDLTTKPFKAFRREMEDWFRNVDQNPPMLSIGAGAPAVNVAETDKVLEIKAELSGVQEKDIKVSLESRPTTVSGQPSNATSSLARRVFHLWYRSQN